MGNTSTDERLPEAKPLFADRQALLKALEELNAATGFVPVPGATAQSARESMREIMEAQGVRPEDNALSREMIARRYSDEEQEWEEKIMPNENLPEAKPLYADRQAALRSLEQVYAEIGFVPDHTGTIEDLHRQMISEGVRPKQNGASHEMIALRYPDQSL